MKNIEKLVNTSLRMLWENGFQDEEILSVVLNNLVIEESFKEQIIGEKQFKQEYFTKLEKLLTSKEELELSSLQDLKFVIITMYTIHMHNYRTTEEFIEELSEALSIKSDKLKIRLFGKWIKLEEAMKKVIIHFSDDDSYLEVWSKSLEYFKKQYLEKIEKLIFDEASSQ